jgi:transposase
MSDGELSRLEVINRVLDGRLTQVAAGRLAGVTDRPVWRLVRRVEARGADGLVSRRRGRPSNNRLPRRFVDQVIAIVRERYADFGPTLASEQLAKRHGLTIGRETLRGLMREAGLWQARSARRKASQQPRTRRSCYGELIQVDGSEHRWFEDRGPMCTVLTYVDDASSLLQLLRFVDGESTNERSGVAGTSMTQYGRAMHELGIAVAALQDAPRSPRMVQERS